MIFGRYQRVALENWPYVRKLQANSPRECKLSKQCSHVLATRDPLTEAYENPLSLQLRTVSWYIPMILFALHVT